MNKAAKQYLRQVKKHLYCPHSLRKEFLYQLEDDIALYCEGQESVTYAQLEERFGAPKEVASDFFAGLDAKTVSRYSYSRLKITYGILAMVLVVGLCGIGVELYDYIQTRVILEQAQSGEACDHSMYMSPFDRSKVDNCTVFYVRTQRKGRDYYWEYHSCVNRFYHALPPKDSDGSEPYAEDIYVNINGETTHWHFGEEHTGWYKVFDDV